MLTWRVISDMFTFKLIHRGGTPDGRIQSFHRLSWRQGIPQNDTQKSAILQCENDIIPKWHPIIPSSLLAPRYSAKWHSKEWHSAMWKWHSEKMTLRRMAFYNVKMTFWKNDTQKNDIPQCENNIILKWHSEEWHSTMWEWYSSKMTLRRMAFHKMTLWIMTFCKNDTEIMTIIQNDTE
jgi:hypothetical protein